jgi:hypothetical protein
LLRGDEFLLEEELANANGHETLEVTWIDNKCQLLT